MEDKEYILEVKNLTVGVEDTILLKEVDLNIRKGEIHIIFGPNGSGKSSLVNTIMGLPGYRVLSGDIIYMGESILNRSLTERAKMGIGLAFQHPPVVEGVTLKTLLQSISRNEEPLESMAEEIDLEDYLTRDVNVGFSGGERKRTELIQLMAQNPQLVMFDEPDSGVDVDSINLMVKIMKKLLEKKRPIRERESGGIIVTHSGVILDSIHANKGYVMVDGRIVCGGSPLDIFDTIKKFGFSKCIREARENEGRE